MSCLHFVTWSITIEFWNYYCVIFIIPKPQIMETEKRNTRDKEVDNNYVNEINGDWMVFKGLSILALIMFLGLLAYFMWFIN